MGISKINFTSSLLGNVQNTTEQNPKPEEQTTVQQPEEEITENSETEVVDNPIAEEKNDHTVRNWSIGLSAAAVLIGLGVAGRKGKLGEGIQKLLGGKPSGAIDHAAGDAAGKGTKAGEEAAEHSGIKIDEISAEEFEQIQNKEADFVWDGKKITSGKEEPKPPVEQPKTEQPKVEQPKAETPKEEPAPTVSEATSETPKNESKPAEVPKMPTITKAEAQAIDASLDRTLPKIEKEMLTVKAPTIQELEKMGFDLSKFEMTAAPDAEIVKIIGDKKYFARYDKSGKLDAIHMGSKDSQYYYSCEIRVDIENGEIRNYVDITNHKTYFYENGHLDWGTVDVDNLQYWYDEKGLLKLIKAKEGDNTVKAIEYVHGTDKPVAVYYGGESYEISELSKIEIFDGMPNPVKEIYIKGGQKITEVV